MVISVKELWLIVGMIYILGMATPVWLLKLLLRSQDEGRLLAWVLAGLALPFGTLLVMFVFGL